MGTIGPYERRSLRPGLPVPTHAVRAPYGSTAVPQLGQGTAPHITGIMWGAGIGPLLGYLSTLAYSSGGG